MYTHTHTHIQDILTCFRGSELQNYFTRVLEDNLKAIIKPQVRQKRTHTHTFQCTMVAVMHIATIRACAGESVCMWDREKRAYEKVFRFTHVEHVTTDTTTTLSPCTMMGKKTGVDVTAYNTIALTRCDISGVTLLMMMYINSLSVSLSLSLSVCLSVCVCVCLCLRGC